MLALSALALLQPQQEVRHLELRGMLLTVGEVKITRTLHADGRADWLEETKWGDGRQWVERRELTPEGRLSAWSVDWRSAPKEKGANDASWMAEQSAAGYQIVKTKYRGEEMSVARTLRLDPSAYSFGHLSMGPGASPISGETAKSLLFIPGIADAGQLYETEVLMGGREEWVVNGQKTSVQKVTLKAEPRNETWWLDSTGLPVRRDFWTKDPASPHRTEVLKKS